MNEELLHKNAQALVQPGKGILAADESTGTAGKRLDSIGLENTEENRRRYRQLFFTTGDIGDVLSGVILYKETLDHHDDDGTAFLDLLDEEGVIPGVKVDEGKKPLPRFPDELVTQGLDDLQERLDDYFDRGARFTKWRSVTPISENTPTEAADRANARGQALYAAFSQDAGLVPIVEPEVLIDGDHTIETAEEVTTRTLRIIFEELERYRIDFEGMLLKSSMVLPGEDCPDQASPEAIADATIRTFHNAVPEEVPGIVFLSGGQSATQATENLNAINRQGDQPWELSFSFGRALQGPSLRTWAGNPDNVPEAQELFKKRLRLTGAARQGDYSEEMEAA